MSGTISKCTGMKFGRWLYDLSERIGYTFLFSTVVVFYGIYYVTSPVFNGIYHVSLPVFNGITYCIQNAWYVLFMGFWLLPM